MKSKPIEVKAKGYTVRIFVVHSTKNGKVYESFQVADYSSGKRKLCSFAKEGDARGKALELCNAMATGREVNDMEVATLYLEKRSFLNAMDEADNIGLGVD